MYCENRKNKLQSQYSETLNNVNNSYICNL